MLYVCMCYPVSLRDPTSTYDEAFDGPCLAAYGGPVDPNVALGGFGKCLTLLWYVYMCHNNDHDISQHYGMLLVSNLATTSNYHSREF